jgi:hypothetical protein
MNTMNIPGFTAEASLYSTSRQYRTGRHAINVPTQTISTITPAMIRRVASTAVTAWVASARIFAASRTGRTVEAVAVGRIRP